MRGVAKAFAALCIALWTSVVFAQTPGRLTPVATVAKLKTLLPPARPALFNGYTPEQWTSTISALDASAKSNLDWVNRLIVWNQNALNASLRARR